jgi:hypothetical protein
LKKTPKTEQKGKQSLTMAESNYENMKYTELAAYAKQLGINNFGEYSGKPTKDCMLEKINDHFEAAKLKEKLNKTPRKKLAKQIIDQVTLSPPSDLPSRPKRHAQTKTNEEENDAQDEKPAKRKILEKSKCENVDAEKKKVKRVKKKPDTDDVEVAEKRIKPAKAATDQDVEVAEKRIKKAKKKTDLAASEQPMDEVETKASRRVRQAVASYKEPDCHSKLRNEEVVHEKKSKHQNSEEKEISEKIKARKAAKKLATADAAAPATGQEETKKQKKKTSKKKNSEKSSGQLESMELEQVNQHVGDLKSPPVAVATRQNLNMDQAKDLIPVVNTRQRQKSLPAMITRASRLQEEDSINLPSPSSHQLVNHTPDLVIAATATSPTTPASYSTRKKSISNLTVVKTPIAQFNESLHAAAASPNNAQSATPVVTRKSLSNSIANRTPAIVVYMGSNIYENQLTDSSRSMPQVKAQEPEADSQDDFSEDFQLKFDEEEEAPQLVANLSILTDDQDESGQKAVEESVMNLTVEIEPATDQATAVLPCTSFYAAAATTTTTTTTATDEDILPVKPSGARIIKPTGPTGPRITKPVIVVTEPAAAANEKIAIKPKPIAASKLATAKSTSKMPDFRAIHEKQANKMESIKDYADRKVSGKPTQQQQQKCSTLNYKQHSLAVLPTLASSNSNDAVDCLLANQKPVKTPMSKFTSRVRNFISSKSGSPSKQPTAAVALTQEVATTKEVVYEVVAAKTPKTRTASLASNILNSLIPRFMLSNKDQLDLPSTPKQQQAAITPTRPETKTPSNKPSSLSNLLQSAQKSVLKKQSISNLIPETSSFARRKSYDLNRSSALRQNHKPSHACKIEPFDPMAKRAEFLNKLNNVAAAMNETKVIKAAKSSSTLLSNNISKSKSNRDELTAHNKEQKLITKNQQASLKEKKSRKIKVDKAKNEQKDKRRDLRHQDLENQNPI